MKSTRVTTMLTFCAAALSMASATTTSSSECERVVVNAASADHVAHTGTFYQVGMALDDTPVFKSDGGYCLQFIEEGSIADEDYSTYIDLSTGSANEIADGSLDSELPTVVAEEVFTRRSLQQCGYWVIGMMGPTDTAMYPMLKVSDCADHPSSIDSDSPWFRQDCHDCDQDSEIGYVYIYTETYACDGSTLAPAATPTLNPTVGGPEPTTPVFPLSPTEPPVEDSVGDGVGDGDEDEDEEEDEEDRSVDIETAGGDNSSGDDGVDAVAVGVGVGVGVAVLGVVALVVVKKMRS
ncbi:unnamed protein product [Scytosiphon promiscuus]